MPCSSFLKFDLLEYPSWRKAKEEYSALPSVSEMLDDIIEYKKIWEERQSNQINNLKEVKRRMFLEFIFRVQQEEQIGISDRESFQDFVTAEWQATKSHQGRNVVKDMQNIQPTIKTMEKQNSIEENTNESPESYECSLSFDELENEIQDKMSARRKQETMNLLKGYAHLQTELKKIPRNERASFLGMIEVSNSILECHGILMDNLIEKSQTMPGEFSTRRRTAEFKGKVHYYPTFKTKEIAFMAVQNVVDKYHIMLDEISKMDNEREQLEYSFKCASVLLFSFLTLHPFSDGNGRLSRLLCDRCLKIFCPFPSPIYNVYSRSSRDDYIDAIVKARQPLDDRPNIIEYEHQAATESILIMEQQPSDLCSLVIESNWFSWRQFLYRIGVDSFNLLSFENKIDD